MSFEDKTLDEIAEHDADNFEAILKKCKPYEFNELYEFPGMLQLILEKVTENMNVRLAGAVRIARNGKHAGELVQQMIDNAGVKIERRVDPENPKRSGLFFYKNNEIAHYISHPEPFRCPMRGHMWRIWATE
jgi:hypothetical protein